MSCLVLMYVLKVLSKDASRMALALGAHGTAVRKQKRLYKIFYTQSLAVEGPYPCFALAGTSTWLTYHVSTTHFLYAW